MGAQTQSVVFLTRADRAVEYLYLLMAVKIGNEKHQKMDCQKAILGVLA